MGEIRKIFCGRVPLAPHGFIYIYGFIIYCLAEFAGLFKWERSAKSFADGFHWHHMVLFHSFITWFYLHGFIITSLADFVGSFKWERSEKSFAEGFHWHHMVFHHYIFPDLKFPIHATVKSCRFYATRKGKYRHLTYYGLSTPNKSKSDVLTSNVCFRFLNYYSINLSGSSKR